MTGGSKSPGSGRQQAPASKIQQEAGPCFEGLQIDTPYFWGSENVLQARTFFEHLNILVPASAILYFEGTTIAPEVAAFYDSHRTPEPVRVARDTLWPVPAVYHVRFSPQMVQFLCEQAERRALQEMFDHVKVYEGQSMLLTFHDAFSGWLCISERLPEEKVKTFFHALGASYSRERTMERDPKQLEQALNALARFQLRQRVLRVWTWVGILTLTLWVYPVAYRTTRVMTVTGLVLCWAGALFLWKHRKAVTLPLAAVAVMVGTLTALPGRPVESSSLGRDYSAGLRVFRGVRYVWGGEGWLGMDCSGLVRQGLVWGQLKHGICTLNGRPVRDALSLWWNDCSAQAMRDGPSGLTRELSRAATIEDADPSQLRTGDLAVTADGVHVLAYLGNRTWMEADPMAGKVVEIALPTTNSWFHVPVVFVRWRYLEPAKP